VLRERHQGDTPPDGHTASLFPETAALKEKSRFVVANWVVKLETYRLTLTLPVLNQARLIAFLVSGTDKAPILHEVLEGKAPGGNILQNW